MSAPSAQLARLQASAGRLLGSFGTVRTFRRWARTANTAARLKGEEVWAPTGSTLQAHCDFDVTSERKADGTVQRYRVLLVEVHPDFSNDGGLITDWRVTCDDGVERRLSPGLPEMLSEDGTYYVVRVEELPLGVP